MKPEKDSAGNFEVILDPKDIEAMEYALHLVKQSVECKLVKGTFDLSQTDRQYHFKPAAFGGALQAIYVLLGDGLRLTKDSSELAKMAEVKDNIENLMDFYIK